MFARATYINQVRMSKLIPFSLPFSHHAHFQSFTPLKPSYICPLPHGSQLNNHDKSRKLTACSRANMLWRVSSFPPHFHSYPGCAMFYSCSTIHEVQHQRRDIWNWWVAFTTLFSKLVSSFIALVNGLGANSLSSHLVSNVFLLLAMIFLPFSLSATDRLEEGHKLIGPSSVSLYVHSFQCINCY